MDFGQTQAQWQCGSCCAAKADLLSELAGGRRRYRLDVPGRLGWLARYLKEVDANEVTVRFWQEMQVVGV